MLGDPGKQDIERDPRHSPQPQSGGKAGRPEYVRALCLSGSSRSLFLHPLFFPTQNLELLPNYSQSKMMFDMLSNDDDFTCSPHFKFTSIKDLLNEDSLRHQRFSLPPAFKAMILGGLLEKYKHIDKSFKQKEGLRMLARWRVNSSQAWGQKAVDRFVSSGPPSAQNFFYRCQRMIRNTRHQENSIKLPSLMAKIISEQSSGKSREPLNFSKQSVESKVFNAIAEGYSEQNISLSDILNLNITQQPAANEEVDHTFTNILESPLGHKNRASLGIEKLERIMTLKKYQNLSMGLRVISQMSLEQNFEQELMTARRNLELAENSLILQNRLQKLDEDHEEQFQNLEKISYELNFLRGKFMHSKTQDLIKNLGAIFYPCLAEAFISIKEQFVGEGNEIKIPSNKYKVQEIAVSSTSLSIGPSIRFIEPSCHESHTRNNRSSEQMD